MIHSIAKRYERVVSVILVVCLSISFWLAPSVSAADTNQLFITPASSQMNIGTTFTVSIKSYSANTQSNDCIKGNSMQSLNGCVDGSITYPGNLLRVTSGGISTTGSGYGTPIITQSSGIITFKGSHNPATTGSAHIFSVTFQAIGAGTATVGFANDSTVNGATTLFKSGVYTIINPNPTQPSTSPSVPRAPTPAPVVINTEPTVTPSADESTVEPQPTPDPSGLIDSVTVDSLYQSSTVAWKVNTANATTSINYGNSASQLDKQASVTKKADGSFTATIPELTPGNRYYFTITAKGADNKDGTYSGTILTRGFPIIMTITENDSPAKAAQVKLGSRSYTTEANGKLSLGLAAGNYSGTITTDTATLTINVTVEKKTVPSDGTAPASQAFSYNLTSSPLEQGPGSNFSVLTFIGVLAGGSLLLGVGFVAFMAYRRRQFDSGDDTAGRISSGPTVVIDDGYTWQQNETDTSIQNTLMDSIEVKDEQPARSNSVVIDDEEPLDMYEKAKLEHSITDSKGSMSDDQTPAAEQNPNSLHSTRL